MGSMRLLIATPLYPPDIGGPATYTRILEQELPKRNISVDIISFGSVKRLPKIIRHVIFFFRVLERSRGCSVVFALDPVSVGLPAFCAAKIAGKRFVVKIVGDYAWEQGVQRHGITDTLDEFSKKHKYPYRVRFLKYVEYIVAAYANNVITPSNYLKKIVSNWGVNSRNITVVYNTFNQSEFKKTRKEIREELGVSGIVIVSVGRLVPWKGFSVLIESMREVITEYPDAILYILGDGPQKDELYRLVKKYKLDKRIVFTGTLSQDYVANYIFAADVFVLNSGYEGLSHVLLEAMSIGTPIVTTASGGNSELVSDSVEGVIAGYNIKDELVRAILFMLSHKKNAREMREQSRKKVEQFNKKSMIEGIINIML